MINGDDLVSFPLVATTLRVILLGILGVVCVAFLNFSFSMPALSLFFGLAGRLGWNKL